LLVKRENTGTPIEADTCIVFVVTQVLVPLTLIEYIPGCPGLTIEDTGPEPVSTLEIGILPGPNQSIVKLDP
jgi:hypothetical protein